MRMKCKLILTFDANAKLFNFTKILKTLTSGDKHGDMAISAATGVPSSRLEKAKN